MQFTHDTIRMMGIHVWAVYCLIACAEQEGITPVTRLWLLDHMPDKTSPNTITGATRWLTNAEHQHVLRVPGGWKLNRENAFQLPLTFNLPEGEKRALRAFGDLEGEKRALRAFENQGSNINFGPFIQRIEEENHLINIDSSSSTISSEKRAERAFGNGKGDVDIDELLRTDENAQDVAKLIRNLPLLFDPKFYGLLEIRREFLVCPFDNVLGWITKAYQDRESLRRDGGPLGLIVARITKLEHCNEYYLGHFREILPIEYLEAVGLYECECDYCDERFGSRAAKEEHRVKAHPYVCMECGAAFKTESQEHEHYRAVHDPDNRNRQTEPGTKYTSDPSVNVPVPGSELTPEQAWQAVLGQLRMEMPRASFDTWVRDTQATRFGDNIISIGVRNTYARDWLESRLASTINRILIGILNANVSVEFVVENQ